MKLAPRGTAAGLSVAVLVVALGVGASATTAALAAPTAATTTSSSTTTTTGSSNVVRSWGFENGDGTGVTGIGGATVALDAAGRRTGALGLHLGSAANYGAGIGFSFDATALANGWYDLWFPVRLATGDPVRMQVTGAGQSGGPAWVNTGWTSGPYLHFQKAATTRTVSVQLTSTKRCPSDPPSPPSELFVDDVTLRTSTVGPQPVPTVGCTSTTTTPVTPTTTTGSGPVTTTPGGLVQHWDFAAGTAGWSPVGGTTLATQADPAGGTDLVVTGVQSPGAGAGVTIDATRLQDGTWYDLVVDLRLPSSVPQPIYYRTAAGGSQNPPVLLSASAWRGATAHFRKQAGQTSITATVTLQAQACSDAIGVTGSVLSGGASLYQAATQAEVPTTTCSWNTPPVTTTTTTPATTTTPGTVIRRWDFGTSDLAAWSPYQGTTLGTQPDAAGGTDLVVSNAGSYGSGATVTVDTTGLTDNAWYDLGVGLRLPAGSPSTLYRAYGNGNWNPPASVTDAAWRGVSAHFRKVAGSTQQQVSVFSIADCAADPAHAPATFLSNGAALSLSTQQAEITWTTTGCPRPTTTTTSTTSTTSTTVPPVTTTTTTTRRTTTSTLPHDDPPPYCRVTYGESRWQGGFQGSIAPTNISPAPIGNWVLEFTLTSGAVIQSAWGGGQFVQQGSRVRLPAPSWAPDLAPGQTVQLGFVATGTGTATGFTLNGTPCS